MFGIQRKYILFCLIGLAICLWGFRGQVQLAALPEDFEIESEAWPIRVDGIDVADSDQMRFLAEGYAPGDLLLITTSSGEIAEVALERAYSPLHSVATFVCGILTWVLCLIVFAPRAPIGVGRDFFWCGLLFCIVIMVGGVYFPRSVSGFNSLPGLIHLTGLAALGPLFVHLSMNFPRRSSIQDRFRWLMPLLFLIAVALVIWRAAVYLSYINDPNPGHGRWLMPALRTSDGLIVIQVLLALQIMFLERRNLELTRERKQIKWLLWGMSIGVLPYVILRAMPRLFGLTPVLPAAIERFLELAIPFSFAFAVVRYRFLDIDIIIRRSVIYAILAAGMAVICLIPGILIGRRLHGDSPLTILLPLLATGVLAGVLFMPLKQMIGRSVDRLLFKIKSDYDQALKRFKGDLQQIPSQQELADRLASFLESALGPKMLVVIVRDRSGTGFFKSVGQIEPADRSNLSPVEQAEAWSDQWPVSPAPDEDGFRTIAKLESSSLPEIEADRFPEPLAQAGFVLGEPLFHDGDRAGLILLGPRQTERRYIETDISMIRECAALAESVLRRLNLVQVAAEEIQARRRLDELNRLKSEFLSQVAHDLRTPLTSIAWSVDNLLDGVVGEFNDSQAEYLRSVKTSASHLNKLVGNLLEISRLEQGRVKMNLSRQEIAALFSEAILAMKGIAAEKQVEIRLTEVPEQAAYVMVDQERLFEVIVNLFDNAIKYSPPGSAVDLSISLQAERSWLFSVRDRGPGFAPEEVNNLFGRFSQGTPSPFSQRHGFGLGLYIVKSYLELMNGDVRAENHPEGGAVVICRLPAAEEI